MSEKSTFFNSVSGDRKYKAEDMALHFSKVLTNGVMPSGTQLQATANSGMSIIVTAGSAWINGYAYHNDSDFTLEIDPADGVLNRIDRVVVRWSRLNRAINLVVIKGVAASSPAAPALVRNVDSYDLGIATISVSNGVTSITQAVITDTRMDNTVCGFVSSLIQPDTAGWFSQFNTAFNDAIDANQGDWDAWFATVQDTLDEDTAGNLLNLINGKADESHIHSGYAQVKVFSSVAVASAAWSSDATYAAFPYSATITASGVTSDMVPEVNFGLTEAASGNFAPVALSGSGTIKIYAAFAPSAAITIPSIACVKAVS